MKIKNYFLAIALVIGALVSFFYPKSMSYSFINDINTIIFIILLFLLSSRFDLVSFDKNYLKSLKLILLYVVASALILTGFFKMVFNVGILEGMIFSVIVCAMIFHSKLKTKKAGLLHIESDLSTPLVIIVAYILIALQRSYSFQEFGWVLQGFQFIKEVIVGIGIGTVVGLFVYFFLRTGFTKMKTLVAFASAFFAYLIGIALEGNGFLSVVVVGLFFGHFFPSNKEVLDDFLKSILVFAEIIAFFMLGYLLYLPWQVSFFLRAIILFAVLLLIRFSSVLTIYKFSIKDAWKATIMPSLSPAIVPLAIIFITSMNFTFMLLGFLLAGFVVFSLVMSQIAHHAIKE
ncbi:MAG: cation:proton antiporter [Nanoarchaeota archaeon]|nr:cation:proton antiporter [Nanoarchaeota archaeon]